MSELNAGKEDSTKTLRGHEDITADDKGNDATTTASAEKDETGRSDDASDPDFCAKKKKRRKLMTQKEREAADEATRARKREWAHKNKVSNKTQRERDQVEIASLRSALSHAEYVNSTLTQQIRLRQTTMDEDGAKKEVEYGYSMPTCTSIAIVCEGVLKDLAPLLQRECDFIYAPLFPKFNSTRDKEMQEVFQPTLTHSIDADNDGDGAIVNWERFETDKDGKELKDEYGDRLYVNAKVPGSDAARRWFWVPKKPKVPPPLLCVCLFA